MEDLSILQDDDLEQDFIDLLNKGFPKSVFLFSVVNLLGDDWVETGKEIVDGDKDLLGKIEAYGSNES